MSSSALVSFGLGSPASVGEFLTFGLLSDSVNDPPALVGQIPNLSSGYDTETHQFELGDYFSGATSYAIAPAVEAGWTFNTTTGQLEIDTNAEGTFGPYTVTASNANGDTDSNAFLVVVSEYWGSGSMQIAIDTGI
jgi:hypothetical protein